MSKLTLELNQLALAKAQAIETVEQDIDTLDVNSIAFPVEVKCDPNPQCIEH